MGITLRIRRATGINDLGQIIGLALNAQGQFTSFLLTPDGVTPPSSPRLAEPKVVPESTTLAIFGLAGLAWWLRKSRRS